MNFLKQLNELCPDHLPNATDCDTCAARWFHLCQFCGCYLGQATGNYYGKLLFAKLPTIMFLDDFREMATLIEAFWDVTDPTAQGIIQDAFNAFIQSLKDFEAVEMGDGSDEEVAE